MYDQTEQAQYETLSAFRIGTAVKMTAIQYSHHLPWLETQAGCQLEVYPQLVCFEDDEQPRVLHSQLIS